MNRKKTVIRPGDQVRIINPRWIRRVGYPLHYQDPDIWDEHSQGERAKAIADILFPPKDLDSMFAATRSIPYDVQVLCAKAEVARRGFGGRERAILYEEPNGWGDYKGSAMTVIRKRTVKTGKYFPARYSNDPEREGYPGGLEDEKTDVLLTTGRGEIEQCDVELLQRGRER